MIGTSTLTRHQAKKATIVAAAWDLARTEGLGGLSLRALAARVGMRQPSLYEYFDSKHALFDAMFAGGNQQLLAHLEAVEIPSAEPRPALRAVVRAFTDFALADLTRQQLLFQRPIPGFSPSPESLAQAEQVLSLMYSYIQAAGITDPGDIDCFVAMVAGLMEAQASNDPGGDRWIRHLDRMIDLHLDHCTSHTTQPTRRSHR